MELTAQRVLLDLSLIGVLLLIGTYLRVKIRLLRRFLIPAAVVGGAIGLVLGPQVIGLIQIDSARMLGYAPVLLQVVFAGLFIGRRVPRPGEIIKIGGAQTAFAVIANFMQIAIGMAVVLVFALFAVKLHPGFGMQLVLAFQGGVGIPTSFAPMYEAMGWVAGEAQAVGETAAVAGLLLAIIVGIVLANVGARRGFTENKVESVSLKASSSLHSMDSRPSMGRAVVKSDAVSPLAYSFGFLGLALLSGYWLKGLAVTLYNPLKFVPPFAFALVTGLLIQVVLQGSRLDAYVDRGSVMSLQGFALDVLIVAAISALSLRVVVAFAAPLLVMLAAGLLWSLWWVMWLAPRLLPGAWFEKALAEFGQGVGSAPSALLLLRTVDPGLQTDAADAFAIKMFLTSPTMVPLMIAISSAITSRGPALIMLWMVGGSVAVYLLSLLVGWRQTRPGPSWSRAASG